MAIQFWMGSHTKHRLLYHFTFIPKYRKEVLWFDIAKRIRQLFNECCQINGWCIHQLEIMPDHVHLHIQTKQTDYPAKIMHYLKGGTSRILRKEFPKIRAFLWGDSFWADGYFVETIGRKDEKTLKKYLDKQEVKHSKKRSVGEAPGL